MFLDNTHYQRDHRGLYALQFVIFGMVMTLAYKEVIFLVLTKKKKKKGSLFRRKKYVLNNLSF